MNGPMWPVFAGADFARGRLFDSSDLDETREISGRFLNPHELRLRGRGQQLRSRMDYLPAGGLSLNRLRWGANVEVDPDHLGRYYLISIPVAGSACFHLGGRDFEVSPRAAAIVNPAQRFHFEADADFDQICVRFERHAVEAAWLALAGSEAQAPINFEPSLHLQSATWRALEPTLALLARSTDGACTERGMLHLHARIEDMLLTTLLLLQLPTPAGHLAAGVATHAGSGGSALVLRRAQAYMLEHLDEPLTLASVARASGAASRSLQAAFHTRCGQGPMQWLREQRLHAVRAVLNGGCVEHTRVTDTAMRYGFTHLGEFSRAYRQLFGEAPSQTLRGM